MRPCRAHIDALFAEGVGIDHVESPSDPSRYTGSSIQGVLRDG